MRRPALWRITHIPLGVLTRPRRSAILIALLSTIRSGHPLLERRTAYEIRNVA
jgi:hypothetical protein